MSFSKKHRKSNERLSFDEWFAKNRDKFSDFPELPSRPVRRKHAPLICSLSVCCAVILVLVCLPFVLKSTDTTEFFYGDTEVYNTIFTETEVQQLCAKYPLLQFSTINNSRCTKAVSDDKLLFAIFECEFDDVGRDYYILQYNLHLNSHYIFRFQDNYTEMTEFVTVDGMNVYYKYLSFDGTMHNYRVYCDDGTVKYYVDVQCFEQSITQFIEIAFGSSGDAALGALGITQ